MLGRQIYMRPKPESIFYSTEMADGESAGVVYQHQIDLKAGEHPSQFFVACGGVDAVPVTAAGCSLDVIGRR